MGYRFFGMKGALKILNRLLTSNSRTHKEAGNVREREKKEGKDSQKLEK